ncbi:MAG: 2-oxoglutarate dehydrogenase complex dihydrolipoyllysine-residue succinyltransferase [Pseudomonadota bacterium]
MSIIEVKVPQLSESVSEATLLTWNKKVGEQVSEGENLIDIETDKVVLELPAIKSGVLSRILKESGSQVVSGEVIAQIDSAASAPVAAPPVAEVKAEAATTGATAVSPSARKLAHEHDVDAATLKGSGKHGLVTKEDVLNAVQAKPASAAAAAPVPATVSSIERTEQRVPMTRIRQRIAERLLQSQANAAILTTFNEVNMQPVMELRSRYKDAFEKKHGVKLGFSSFFVKAAVHALKKFPVVNASVDGTDVLYHNYFDIGVAIGSERGLVVPIIRDADRISFADIERRIADFAARAKDGKIGMEELAGGTFSITNGGVFGSMLSTPIVNPPQSAILGMHAIQDRPVAVDGQVVIRPVMYVALTYDHRIVDGREAVLFLRTIKERIENPAPMLLEG